MRILSIQMNNLTHSSTFFFTIQIMLEKIWLGFLPSKTALKRDKKLESMYLLSRPCQRHCIQFPS